MKKLLKKYPVLLERWNEHWRYWHNTNHLYTLLNDISKLKLSDSDKNILELIAIFHDIVYYPWRSDNEKLSIEYFLKFNQSYNIATQEQSEIIVEAIERTGDDSKCESEYSSIFRSLDRKILSSEDLSELIDYENKIFKEFQCFNYLDYKQARLEFISKVMDSNPNKALSYLKSYIEMRVPNIAVYPGSFDPFHIGHLDILQKAEEIFDKVVILYGINPDKVKDYDNKAPSEFIHPIQKIENKIINRECWKFYGKVTSEIDDHSKYANVTLLRGLRDGKDLDYEVNQFKVMEDMHPELKEVFIICNRKYTHISSSMVRGLIKLDHLAAQKYLI